jgi:hypothetical protein
VCFAVRDTGSISHDQSHFTAVTAPGACPISATMCDRDLEANGVAVADEEKGDSSDAYLRKTKIENDNAHLEPR